MGRFKSFFTRSKAPLVDQGPWEQLETAGAGTQGTEGDSRPVRMGPGALNRSFCGNAIHTAKYNVITFLPLFLFTMFSRVAYLYFLAQASLAWWRTVSPFTPWGPTIALSFVLGVAAIKAIAEDRKRHIEDRKINASIAHVIQPDGSVQDVKWKRVRVGDLLQVRDDEDIPADLVCVGCAHPDNVCFIKTTNLDGESNLKIRRPVDMRQDIPHDEAAAARLQGLLRCEPPNPNLHYFVGKFSYRSASGAGDATTVPVTMNEVLLRGCTLKNSGSAIGLVVYTGAETRIQMNAAAPPRKMGSFDQFLNIQIILVILLQFLLVLGSALTSLGWRNRWGQARYYLALTTYVQGNPGNNFAYVVILFFTFWILFSYLVPISLFVTLEIVKFVLCTLYIMFDPLMRDPVTRELARARNSDIVEDLGQVEYVFSDKTGTLTSNEMQLRLIAIKGIEYGSLDFRLEDSPGKSVTQRVGAFDERLLQAVSVMGRAGFWRQLASSGGSHTDILALASSQPSPRAVREQPVLQRLVQAPLNDVDDLISLVSPGASPSPGSASKQGGGGSWGPGRPEGPALNGAPLSPLDADGSYRNGSGRDDSTPSPSVSSNPTSRAQALVLGHHIADFWTIICICHSLIVEANPKPGRAPVYQGPSPDEVALVDAARALGFEFKRRSRTHITLLLMGHEVTYELLNVLEFTSERARMSVVARAPDGTIRLYTKGSDAMMLTLLKKETEPALLAATNDNLRMFSIQGLRTLVLASRVVGAAEWETWNRRYQKAAASLEGREAAIADVAAQLEHGLDLVGVTAIEDKLQRGVPQAIKTLIAAGIKVWMITGDKQETAINIAISCKLIQSPEGAMLCNAAASPEQAMARLAELLRETEERIARSSQSGGLGDDAGRRELVIDGKTLSHILGSPAEALLASLAAQCSALVICRASPSQKAGIVRMMKRYVQQERLQTAAEGQGAKKWLRWLWKSVANRLRSRGLNTRMLAIGDGANDVAMIQAADIGVGIMGKEGRQAVNNSDFAFTQFRFLTRLLLVHGTLADYRLGRLIKYSFYKNIAFAFMLFFYQFFCGFSGQALLDGVTAAFYNAFFTAFPAGLFAMFDRPVKFMSTLMDNPQVYNRRPPLTGREFWKTAVLLGIFHGAVVFFIPYLSIVAGNNHSLQDVWSLGKTMFIAMIGTVTLEIGLVSRFWTFPFFAVWFLSFVLAFPWLVLLPLLLLAFGSNDSTLLGIGNYLLASPLFWMEIILVWAITYGSRFMERSCRWLWDPNDDMILAEMETNRAPGKGPRLASQLELGSYDSGLVSPADSYRSSASVRLSQP